MKGLHPFTLTLDMSTRTLAIALWRKHGDAITVAMRRHLQQQIKRDTAMTTHQQQRVKRIR